MEKMKPQKPLLQLVMLALLTVVSLLGLSGESFAADCGTCHGNGVNQVTNRMQTSTDIRPLDTGNVNPAYRNITTGAVKGNHQTHLSATVNPNMCARCHNNSGYTTSHRSGTITMNKANNGGLIASSYDGAGMKDGGSFVFKNQTSVPVLGTCSSVNCHFEAVTPAWGAAAFVSPTDCNKCHGNTGATLSLAHSGHLANANVTCDSCHSARPNFQHATSAGNAGRNIDLNGARMLGATYGVSNFNYLPSQVGTRAVGSCDTVYCHSRGQSSDGTSATPAAYAPTAPDWRNDIGALQCDSCHQYAGIFSGSHAKHVAVNSECGNCHTGAAGQTMTSPTHVDGLINVNGSQAVGYSQGVSSIRGNGYGNCSNLACHSVFTPAVSPTITWGTVATCSSCHAASPVSGSHTLHIALPSVTCATCHTAPGATGHINNKIDVALGFPLTQIDKHASGVYSNACSTTCHSPTTSAVTTPTWGQHTTCVSCHGNSVATLTTGDHTKHLGATALLPVGLCGGCHTGASAATSGGPNHGNTLIDVGGTLVTTYGTAVPVSKGKGSATATCTTTCHNAYSTTVGKLTPTWGGAPANCGSCHEASPQTGDHTKHIAAVALGGNDCASCHTGATPTTYVSANHFDGLINVGGSKLANVAGNYGATKTKGSAAATCTTTCHNAYSTTVGFLTPTWGGAPANCGSCHAATPQTGDHTSHLQHVTVVTGTMACGMCHTGATAGVSGGAGHFDGSIDVAGSFTPSNATPAKHAAGSNYISCSTVACHNGGNGVGGAFVAPRVTWGNTLTCNGCHAYPPSNTNHTGVNGTIAGVCNSCHNNVTKVTLVGTASGTAFTNIQLHMNGVVEGGKCNACHGYPPVRVSDLASIGNHDKYSSARLQNYSGGGGAHAVAGHIPKNATWSDAWTGNGNCTTCHYGVNHNQYGNFSTHHVQVVIDPNFKFDKNRPIVYNGVRDVANPNKKSGTCSNVSCHFQKTPIWATETYTRIGH
jgi:predicted CxxxxCH...CXXCH cytochrome family protein